MNGEKTKKLVDSAIEDLAASLEEGKSESLRAYLTAMGRFHRYSVGNAILIALQRPGATHVAGVRTWNRLGRHVQKGERGIAILAPIVLRVKPEETGPAQKSIADFEGNPGVERMVRGFRTAFVFDKSQTAGEPLAAFATVKGDPGELLERLRGAVARKGIKLRYAGYLCGADGLSAGGVIVLRTGMNAAEEFSTMVHELAHEVLHRDGTKRPKVVKETEAEAVAFVVCEAARLDTNTASRDYIHLYDGDKKALMASLERIRTVALGIIESVMPASKLRGVTSRSRHSDVETASVGRAAA